VNVELQTCTCPDHQEAGFKCKHLYAVEFTADRLESRRGSNPCGSRSADRALAIRSRRGARPTGRPAIERSAT
jgi:hypothetical protein